MYNGNVFHGKCDLFDGGQHEHVVFQTDNTKHVSTLLFPLLVSIEEQRQWVVPIGAGCFATGWNCRTHFELGSQQLCRGGTSNLVLPAQYPLPRRLPGCLSQVLQRAERLWRWRRRRAYPPFQNLSPLGPPQVRDLLREVVSFSHAALHSALLPPAALPQPNRGAVGSSSWCGTLA